jgi:hypothetical protein
MVLMLNFDPYTNDCPWSAVVSPPPEAAAARDLWFAVIVIPAGAAGVYRG